MEQKSEEQKDFMVQISFNHLCSLRKEAGRSIDPETAEVTLSGVYMLDIYDDGFELPEECRQVQVARFARNRGSNAWICFGDLPAETLEKLLGKSDSDEFSF